MVQNSPNSQKWSEMVFLIINSMGWPIYQVQPGSCIKPNWILCQLWKGKYPSQPWIMVAKDIFPLQPWLTFAKRLILWNFAIKIAFWTPLFKKFHKSVDLIEKLHEIYIFCNHQSWLQRGKDLSQPLFMAQSAYWPI